MIEIEKDVKANIKWFSREKGYGFVTDTAGRDIFLHSSVVPNEMTLNDGDAVTVSVQHGEKGLNCTKIARLHDTFVDL